MINTDHCNISVLFTRATPATNILLQCNFLFVASAMLQECCGNVAGMLQKCCKIESPKKNVAEMLQKCCRFFSATFLQHPGCGKNVARKFLPSFATCSILVYVCIFCAVAQLCPANTNQRGTLQTQPSQSRHII